jgi:aerobic C4-dicarboxylate transport protein
MIVKLVPLAAFGSIAYTIGKYGAGTIGGLFKLVLVFYGTVAFFIIFILGAVLWYYKINIFKFIRYIGEEILLVVTTTSSEVGMPALIQKLEDLGCGKSTSSLVVTSGFSFNMDGSYIYLTLAYVFLAQALGIQMSFQDQVIFFLVAAITSKGAAGVAGSGFITLASTIAMTPNQTIPVQSIALLLAIDQFMSMGRAITNYVGNGVAGLVLSIWEKEVKGREVNKKLDK